MGSLRTRHSAASTTGRAASTTTKVLLGSRGASTRRCHHLPCLSDPFFTGSFVLIAAISVVESVGSVESFLWMCALQRRSGGPGFHLFEQVICQCPDLTSQLFFNPSEIDS